MDMPLLDLFCSHWGMQNVAFVGIDLDMELKAISWILQLQSPGVLAIGSSMKGENSYSHHLDSDVS